MSIGKVGAQRLHREQTGFSLVEMMLSTAVLVIVLGSAFTMIQMLQFTGSDRADRADSHRAARSAMEWLQRDLLRAGVGIQTLIAPFPVLVPRVDGGIDTRSRGSGPSLPITNMTANKNVFVADSTGFQVGQAVAVHDNTGSIEVGEISTIDANPHKITLAATMSKNYDAADGAAIVHLTTISYFVDTAGATPTLMRRVDQQAAQPIATNMLAFALVYFDDSTPSVAFTPVTIGEMLRIRSVDVSFQVEADSDPLAGPTRPSFTLATRTAPRSVALLQ